MLSYLVLFLALIGGSAATGTWGYGRTHEGVYGPADWGHVSKDCDDRSQSPVNIDTSKVDIVGSGHVDRERVQFKELSSYAGGTLANNGHSLTFTVKEGGMTFKNPINGQNYELAQIHFHFGCDDSVGSEHTVDGKHYPGEMHLVLFNTKYGDIDTAATKPDGLTVIAVFLEKDNYKGRINVLTGFSMRAGKISNEGAEIPFGVRLANLVPGFVNGRLVYYSYQGSLTTPGCYQSVSWLVLFKPIKADGFVFANLRKLKSTHGYYPDKMCNNFRPTQPLNGRKIKLDVSGSD